VVLTVLTLNTHKGFSLFNRSFVLHELRESLRSVAADIVFLQEVVGQHDRHALRHLDWPSSPQYEFLADSIWPDYAYGRNAVYTHGHHGNAILSKYPIEHFRNHDVSIGRIEQRGILHCVLRIPGSETRVHAMCAHLGLRESHRHRQLARLCKLIGDDVPPGASLIVAGDFNDWRQKAHAPLIEQAGLREAFVEHRGTAARTFPATRPLLPLDRIYVRNLSVLYTECHSRAPWSRLSDHAALLAQIRLDGLAEGAGGATPQASPPSATPTA
jgi:endonuclease/exonuclease/phosphatase family metal-dependent hydrolase